MKARIPIAIGIVVLTLLFCLWGPVPRLVFLLLCSLAATWETWTILTKDGHWGYAAILLAFVLACGALSLCHAALLWYAVAFFAGSLFGTLLAVSQTEHWLWPFAVGQLTAWICDSAALVVGKQWGKRPLPTPVSPHKTVEGCIAGAIAALPTGLLCWCLFRGACPLSLWAWMLICLLCSSWGQIGDLAASLVKRACGAKDFSNLLGPHGGVMDKFDSMVFSIPLAYLCLKIMGVM